MTGRQIARGQKLIPQKQTCLFLCGRVPAAASVALQLMDWRIEAHFMHYVSLFASHGPGHQPGWGGIKFEGKFHNWQQEVIKIS